MSRRFIVVISLGLAVAGCGRTQTMPRPLTNLDARSVVEPSTPVDAMNVADAGVVVDTVPDTGTPYPMVDGGDGRRVIDPQYVWNNFDSLLEGTWLIGWYGGENHFSWIRFPPTDGKPFGDAVQVLSAADVSNNRPYWECSGAGSWAPTARPATVDLTMPSGCAREILIFDTFRPVSSAPGAILEADILACRGLACGDASVTKLVGVKFPARYCNSGLTLCEKPF